MQSGHLQAFLVDLECRYGRRIGAGWTEIDVWLRRINTRRRLGELDARALADIGLTEGERRREFAKWFWQG